MKKILITGGLGFIGSNLAEECIQRNHHVTILTRSLAKLHNIDAIRDSVKVVISDIRDIDTEVAGHDWIFHFAGTTSNYSIMDDPHVDIDINCNGTIALLEACRKHNPHARIVMGSTFFVNGQPSSLPVHPGSPCEPLGLYGATKLAAEHFCKIYNRVYDLNAAIVRFSNVFGIREQTDNKEKAGFNYLINQALNGEVINLYNNGDFYRDYLYVSDAVNASLVVAERGEASGIYYVGRGEFIKFRQLVDWIIQYAGSGSVVPVDPPDFHKRVGINDFICDVTPLRALGWQPEVALRDGVQRTVDYYRLLASG